MFNVDLIVAARKYYYQLMKEKFSDENLTKKIPQLCKTDEYIKGFDYFGCSFILMAKD